MAHHSLDATKRLNKKSIANSLSTVRERGSRVPRKEKREQLVLQQNVHVYSSYISHGGCWGVVGQHAGVVGPRTPPTRLNINTPRIVSSSPKRYLTTAPVSTPSFGIN